MSLKLNEGMTPHCHMSVVCVVCYFDLKARRQMAKKYV